MDLQILTLRTFKHTFYNGGFLIEEYIQGIIREHLDIVNGEPIRIKVDQIHNLPEFYADINYKGLTERILIVENLKQVEFTRNVAPFDDEE